MPIKSWSHSRIVTFETCGFRAWLAYDQKVPEPPRPLPPGKTEHANDRGTRMHTAAEEYVRDDTDELIPELGKFQPQFDLMRVLYAEGLVSLEGEWGMGIDWSVAEWREAWLRLKLDALVHWSPEYATVIDYKSGKMFGNEVKHAEQLQLYQLVTFLRYPKLETVEAELWYLDHGEVTRKVYTREQGLRFLPRWESRGLKLTTATEFPPRPNVHACKYCEYGPWGTGHCEKGVRHGYVPPHGVIPLRKAA
jgi:CRISPR/Cas system-associated exonuclease Cas4 (RecB family)